MRIAPMSVCTLCGEFYRDEHQCRVPLNWAAMDQVKPFYEPPDEGYMLLQRELEVALNVAHLYREALIRHGIFPYRKDDGTLVTEVHQQGDWGEPDPEKARQRFEEVENGIPIQQSR